MRLVAEYDMKGLVCVLFIFFFKVGVNNMYEAIENDPLEREKLVLQDTREKTEGQTGSREKNGILIREDVSL